HSKLMLVDDEFAIIGSANIGQRSMACDSEIAFGVVDADGELVRTLRTGLWSIHMWSDERAALVDPRRAVTMYYEHAVNERGRLRLRSSSRLPLEIPYRWIMNQIIDPYHGPDRGGDR
ncbi:MAG: phospholipase D-like domain-containing protein, partial [Acidimicrobiales bacterium]